MNMIFNAKTQPAPPEGRVTRVPKFSEKIFGTRVTRPSESAVALVITLILLSVITFLAIAFLALSRRERGSVTTTTHMTEAKFASDIALERAKVEIIANIFAHTNEFAFGLIVSTNYINANGFDPNQPLSEIWPTNLNYEYLQRGNRFKAGQLEQVIANLFYNPRPPVFIPNPTNRNLRDFRFYLDLNRNGRYDTNGLQPVLDNLGKPIRDANRNFVSNFFVGDPEWIGGLDRPDFSHSSSNRFTHRYAYLVVPAGKTLDANFIHNQAVTKSVANAGNDGFMRNEGVGTWEINLAAFLADLNTNQWNPNGISYKYQQPAFPNSGLAFDDARSFLNHRYAGNYSNLRSVNTLFGATKAGFIANNQIDEYSDGDLFLTANPPAETPPDPTALPWVGDDNPNHFFTTQDFFDPSKTSPFFVNRLLSAGTNVSSYDRNTFSRLTEQLGTDSAPEQKLNINYKNVDKNGNVVVGMETNFTTWKPVEFFTNAAQRLLKNAGYPWATGTNIHIPVFNITNSSIGYTPSVHRFLQLAANLYDSTTNRPFITRNGSGYPNFPSVFRPIFANVNNGDEVYIVDFRELNDSEYIPTIVWNARQLDLSYPAQRAKIGQNQDPSNPDLVKGIPLVIGAKKGFPNFNEFASQNLVRVSRILQFRKDVTGGPVTKTNQQYLVDIENRFGVEFWNSYYRSNFSRPLSLLLSNEFSVVITNQAGTVLYTNNFSFLPPNLSAATPPNPWPPGNFFLPFRDWTNFAVMPLTNATTVPLSSSVYVYPVSNTVPLLHLVVKNHLRAMLSDISILPGRIVDYVDLTGMNFDLDIASELAGNVGGDNNESVIGQMFKTNTLANGVNEGINNQIEVNKGNIPSSDTLWRDYNKAGIQDKAKGIAAFRAFFGIPIPGTPANPTNFMQAPFNPTRQIVQTASWQANDPLVHYFVGDLVDLTRTNNVNYLNPTKKPTLKDYGATLGTINTRYHPWGVRSGRMGDSVGDVQTDYNLALKDPLVTMSDAWDFPTNKYPNVGWMGRVHRGTPWQTVFLKSTNIWNLGNGATWLKWTGDGFIQNNWYGRGNVVPDAQYTAPTNDWAIFDLFTAAPNDNAGRGQHSVNQSGLAAWSAVLSGVVVLTNSAAGVYDPFVIQPAGAYDPFNPGTLPPLVKIVDGINRARTNTVPAAGPVFPNQQFNHVGDILAAPELTVNSPFLNLNNAENGGIPDAVYERIPQQIFGLLRKGDQRFVIYAYGQSLRPADNSVLTSGSFRGMCTNYQIMAEVAARAVVRMDIHSHVDSTTHQTVIDGADAVVESYNLLPPD